MIYLPDTVAWPVLQSKITRGSVLRTLFQFENGDHFKRMIVLNNDFSLNEIHFIYTTGQSDYYIRNKDSDIIKSNTLLFTCGQTPLNPDSDMVIDCRKIRQISKEKLVHNWNLHKLDFLGFVPLDIMAKIDEILLNSLLIAPKIKRYILPN
jgi:hypothetical protein